MISYKARGHRFRQGASRNRRGLVALGLVLAGLVAWQRWGDTRGDADGQAVRATFGLCHEGGGRNCVVDGDTLWLGGEKIRIAGIDAPETHDFRCPAEQALGTRTTRRLQQLLNGGAITLTRIDRDRDVQGRKLRELAADGRDVGETLVREGLARRYGGRKKGWC